MRCFDAHTDRHILESNDKDKSQKHDRHQKLPTVHSSIPNRASSLHEEVISRSGQSQAEVSGAMLMTGRGGVQLSDTAFFSAQLYESELSRLEPPELFFCIDPFKLSQWYRQCCRHPVESHAQLTSTVTLRSRSSDPRLTTRAQETQHTT